MRIHSPTLSYYFFPGDFSKRFFLVPGNSLKLVSKNFKLCRAISSLSIAHNVTCNCTCGGALDSFSLSAFFCCSAACGWCWFQPSSSSPHIPFHPGQRCDVCVCRDNNLPFALHPHSPCSPLYICAMWPWDTYKSWWSTSCAGAQVIFRLITVFAGFELIWLSVVVGCHRKVPVTMGTSVYT